MEDIVAAIFAGALFPSIAILVKALIIDKVFERTKKELLMKSSDGKIKKFLVDANSSENDLKNVLESELIYEDLVRKSINKYINNHKNMRLSLSEGKHIDFLLESDGKKIGIEAKSSIDTFKAEWLKNYFENNSSIDELIFISNSKISDSLIKEMKALEKDYKLKFISSPNGRNLNKSLENVLNSEYRDMELNKTIKGTP